LIHDLSRAASLLAWDERTMMPPAGGEARAQQLATLARVRHEMFIDEEIGRLIDRAQPESPIDEDLVRVVERDWRKATLVPAELRAEMAHASSTAERAWVEAKAASDFAMLHPHLDRNLELARRYADCYEGFEGFEHPYDPLLDEYEPEMSTAQMRAVLGELREGLVPIVAQAEAGPADDAFKGQFPIGEQEELLGELVAAMPFPEGYWRLDPTEHPFATSVGQATCG
jgi:carboxypeptidase Taq